MASTTSIVQLLSYSLLTLTLTSAQLCYPTGNFTTNSTYAQNRNLILSSLASNTTLNHGFYTSTIGHDSEMVYALALCRGDLSPENCFNCINSSSHEINQGCPYQKEAVGWANNNHRCIVRVSDKPLLRNMQTRPAMFVFNTNNITTNRVDEFDQAFDSLVGDLEARAAMGPSRPKISTGHTKFDGIQNLYALMQCTPDLLSTDCRNCLRGAVEDYQSCCRMKQVVNILRPSCIFQYAIDKFYESTIYDAPPPPPSPPPPPPTPLPSPPLPPPPTSSSDNGRSRSRTVVIIVVPTVISFVLISLACAFLLLRKRVKDIDVGAEDAIQNEEESLKFDFGKIRVATNDFSETNKLGEGGFGSVYKGRLLNGQEIAVKRLGRSTAQAEIQFKNEIVFMARLQHKNLVRLLGFCFEGKERLLIYEFVPNASLDHFIFDPIKKLLLNWEARFKIILGTARGILYLHEDSQVRIIHRDLKAANVLLDEQMNAKISDFGTARLFLVDQSQDITKRIAGTFGYMPPEYVKFGKVSAKTDVFSFGVLLLEIVSGKKNSSWEGPDHVEHFVSHAWKNWKKGSHSRLIDPTIIGSSSEQMRCIHIGLLCVQEDVAKRPTMASVVAMLNGFSTSLPLPSKPGFLVHGSRMKPLKDSVECFSLGANGSDHSTNQTVNFSINEASISELSARS